MTLALPSQEVTPWRLQRSERQQEAYHWEVVANPEVLSLKAVDTVGSHRRFDHDSTREADNELLASGAELSVAQVVQLALEVDADRRQRPNDCTRGEIEGWSSRSRMRMIRALGSVDMKGRFAMLTLTYPGDWMDGLRRTPDVVRSELAAFRKRYERRWGPAYGAWKIETQQRGAPHWHIVLRLPDLIPWVDVFKWCRVAWHEIICHGGGQCVSAGSVTVAGAGARGDERCPDVAHLHRGAHMDGRYADRVREGRSTVASYFAKHGMWRSKEGQNEAPSAVITRAMALVRTLAPLADPAVIEAWQAFAEAWSTPGRWWGIWRLERIETARDDCVDHDTVRVARLIARKIIGRRSQRLAFHEWEDGRLSEVPVRRTMRSLHGYADCGFWMTARDGREMFWWLLSEARVRRHLSGRELAVSLAGLELPSTEPARYRRAVRCELVGAS